MATSRRFTDFSSDLDLLSISSKQRSIPKVSGHSRPTLSSQRSVASENLSQYSGPSKKKHKLYPCSKCSKHDGKGFTSPNDLERHLRSVHGILNDGDRVWQCPVAGCASAGKIWTRLDNCKAHILRHGLHHESHIALAETIYCSTLHQRRQTSKPLRTPVHGIESHSTSYPRSSTSSNRLLNSPWREISPSQVSDRSPGHSTSFSSAMKPDPNSYFEYSDDSDWNDLAAVGKDFDEFPMVENSLEEPYLTINLQDVDAYEPVSIANPYPWVEAKKLLQENLRDVKQRSISPIASTMNDSLPLTQDIGQTERPFSVASTSYKSEGDKYFQEHQTIDVNNQPLSLDKDEQHVAYVLANLILHQFYRLKKENRLPTMCSPDASDIIVEKRNEAAGRLHPSQNLFSGRKRSRGEEGLDLSTDSGKGCGQSSGDLEPQVAGQRVKKLKMEHSTRPSFACPYHKADPVRYSSSNTLEMEYRSCGTCPLQTISSVEEHLYQTHKRPEFYCAFCYIVFETPEMRDAHHRETYGNCGTNKDPFADKMTYEAYTSIKIARMSKLMERHEREEYSREAWFRIFRTIFPQEPVPLSPYSDDQMTIWNHVESFQVLGHAMAQHLYKSPNNSVSGRSLPPLTQAIIDEAYRIFSAELANHDGDLSTSHAHDRWQTETTMQDSFATERPILTTFSLHRQSARSPVTETSRALQGSLDEHADMNSMMYSQNGALFQKVPRGLSSAEYFANPNSEQYAEQLVSPQSPILPSWHSVWYPSNDQGPWDPLLQKIGR